MDEGSLGFELNEKLRDNKIKNVKFKFEKKKSIYFVSFFETLS